MNETVFSNCQDKAGNRRLQPTPEDTKTTVYCILTPQFSMHTLATATEVFQKANNLSGNTLVETKLCSFDGDSVTSYSGLPIPAAPPPGDRLRTDLILVFAAESSQNYQNPNLLSWRRLQHRRGLRMAGIDVGAFILARCGLLDECEATSRWHYLPGLKERFPNVLAIERVFCFAGRLATSAGGQSTADLMLHMVEQKHNDNLARDVAASMLCDAIRGPDTRQRPRPGTKTDQMPPQVSAAVYLVEENVSSPLTVPQIAARVGQSQQQLERQFRGHIGYGVVKVGLLTRVEHACDLIRATGLSVLDVSTACGFNSVSHFSTAFRQHFKMTPSDYRVQHATREVIS